MSRLRDDLLGIASELGFSGSIREVQGVKVVSSCLHAGGLGVPIGVDDFYVLSYVHIGQDHSLIPSVTLFFIARCLTGRLAICHLRMQDFRRRTNTAPSPPAPYLAPRETPLERSACPGRYSSRQHRGPARSKSSTPTKRNPSLA